jgi:hypothetical protein
VGYGLGLSKFFNKEIDFDTDVLKVMLTTATYTPNNDTHAYKSDVTNEVTGTGYTAGGATVTGSISVDTTNNRIRLIITDPSWPTSTITARTAVLYDSSPATDATRPLIAYLPFGSDVVSTGGTFLIDADQAEGVVRFGY